MACTTDKLQTMIDFVRDIKPFHTKIYEVQLTYQFVEHMVVTTTDDHTIDGTIVFDYDYETLTTDISNGWDSNVWDDIWRFSSTRSQPIIEINPVDHYISFVGDVAYSFSIDAYNKGVTPVDVNVFDRITGTFRLDRNVPWVTGYEVRVEASMLFPAPLTAEGRYYAIMDAPNIVRLASSKSNALLGIGIDYTTYAAGSINIRATQHLVVIQPMGVSIVVTDTNYDITTNRTRIYLTPESFPIEYGVVDIYVDSNWDVGSADIRTSSYTTVDVTFVEDMSFDFTDTSLNDLVGIGPTELGVDDRWGGGEGVRIVLPVAINRPTNKFIVVGDWRYYMSAELSSSSDGIVTIQSYNQPSVAIDIESHLYIDDGITPPYTEFTSVDPLPDQFTLDTQLQLYTNTLQATPISTGDSFWDNIWDQSGPIDDNTTETAISETIQIFVDQGSSSPVAIGTWDGYRWDYVGLDQDIF
jgi:hypothetical protein